MNFSKLGLVGLIIMATLIGGIFFGGDDSGVIEVAGASILQGDTVMRSGANVLFDGGHAINATNGIINLRDWGATGDGVTDDTAAIQSAFSHGGYIFVPDGTYMINISNPYGLAKHGGIRMVSDTVVMTSGNHTFRLAAHNSTHYEVFELNDVNNITIYDINIDGNRDENTATSGEYGYGIMIINGSTNINLINPTTKNCWGDGINLNSASGVTSHNENIVIQNAISIHNRRQGLSIEDGIGVWVNGGNFSYTDGTSPQFGIDIEPWHGDQMVDDIFVTNAATKNNTGGGITINLGHLANTTEYIDIYIDGHYSYGGLYSAVTRNTEYVNASIVFNTPRLEGASSNAVICENKDELCIVDVINPIIIDCNQGEYANQYGAAFLSHTNSWESGAVSGGLHIRNPIVRETLGILPYYIFYINDGRDPAIYPRKNIFIDPIELCDWGYRALFIKAYDLILTDEYGLMKYTADAAVGSSAWAVYSDIGFSADRQIDLSSSTELIGLEQEFIIESGSYSTTINPGDSDYIIPTGTGAGKYIRSSTIGSSATLKKISANYWLVTDMEGTWTAEA